MPRLSIYVSNDLAEKLEAAQQGPLKLNVSQVCQKALEQVLIDLKSADKPKKEQRPTQMKRQESVESRMERMRVAAEGARQPLRGERAGRLGRVAPRS